MKKHVRVRIIVLIVLLVLACTPMHVYMSDGGSEGWYAILWQYTKYHEMLRVDEGWRIGPQVTLLGFIPVYDGTQIVADEEESFSEVSKPVIPFTITIEEPERYHFMELKITDGQVLNSFSNQTQYLFTVVSRADHRITLSCDEWVDNGAQEKTLFLSIRDSTLQTYVTLTFQNVVLHDNAHIILSNDGSALIIVKDDTGETTHSGFISQIS